MLGLPEAERGWLCELSGVHALACASVPSRKEEVAVTRPCSMWGSTAAEELGGWVPALCAGLGCAGLEPG